MFSGIVEIQSPVVDAVELQNIVRIKVEKPHHFNDLKIGHSILVDGVCLTVEEFNDQTMTFAIAAETLQITQWSAKNLLGRQVNLERSLSFGDRVHGHFVSGHVDGLGKVVSSQFKGESLFMSISFSPDKIKPIWKKGSVTVNGVSLTVNEVKENQFSVCLVPETQKQTNLTNLKPGSFVNLEVDQFARAMSETFLLNLDRFKDLMDKGLQK